MQLKPINLKELPDKFALREVQKKALDMVRGSFKQGNKRTIVHVPTSGGKTILAGMMFRMAFQKNPNCQCWFIAPRITLLNQTKAEFERIFGYDCGTVQGNSAIDLSKHVQISTIQTLANRLKSDNHNVYAAFNNLPVGVLAIDECFSGETLIDTPRGKKPIMDMSNGDIVFNALGIGVVKAIKTSLSDDLFIVRLSNGESIKCTGKHRFFTENGWEEARELVNGQRVFRKEDMPYVLEGVQPKNREEMEGRRIHRERAGASVDNKAYLLSVLLEEAEEPNVRREIKKKIKRYIEENRASTYNSRRQRARDDLATKGINREARGGLDSRVCANNKNERMEGGSPSVSLQDRHSKCRTNDCHRSRRIISLGAGAEKARQKERSISVIVRVESVSSIKQEGARTVYNLQVSGHPSYFANGVLVHNCHIKFAGFEIVKDAWDCHMVGLSATPFSKGLGLFWQDVVRPKSMENLIKEGVISDYKVRACVAINRQNLSKTSTGEYKNSDVEEESVKIIGDVYQEWADSEDAKGRPFLGFTTTIATCIALSDLFNDKGAKTAFIHSKMNDEDVQSTLDAFKAGFYDGVFSVVKLIEGFDFPEASMMIDCAPLAPSKDDQNVPNSAARYVQKLGRVIRQHESKEYALVHDHANNFLQYGMIEEIENLYPTLDNGVKGEAIELTPEERIKKAVKECPSCGMIMKGVHCDICGHVLKKPTQFLEAGDIEFKDGKMIEIKKTNKEKINRPNMTMQEKVFLAQELKGHCLQKKKNSPGANITGYYAHKLKSLTGSWPKADTNYDRVKPKRPSDGLMSWIKSENIRFAKRKKTS